MSLMNKETSFVVAQYGPCLSNVICYLDPSTVTTKAPFWALINASNIIWAKHEGHVVHKQNL